MNLTGKERILMVDDEFLLVKILQRILENCGYTVTILTDSREALKLVQSNPGQFDLIVTDQIMPGLTGSELAAAVLRAAPSMPIILYSGDCDLISAEEVLNPGIKKYLTKPLPANELVEAVRMVLNENQVRKSL